MKLPFMMIVVLALLFMSCGTTKEDGTALLAANQMQSDEFTAMADAFASITQRSSMTAANKAIVLDRIASSRGNYQRLSQAVQMLINQLTEVDARRLLPEADFWLDRYLPPAQPLPPITVPPPLPTQ